MREFEEREERNKMLMERLREREEEQFTKQRQTTEYSDLIDK